MWFAKLIEYKNIIESARLLKNLKEKRFLITTVMKGVFHLVYKKEWA